MLFVFNNTKYTFSTARFACADISFAVIYFFSLLGPNKDHRQMKNCYNVIGKERKISTQV
jgi:hypothetical protein